MPEGSEEKENFGANMELGMEGKENIDLGLEEKENMEFGMEEKGNVEVGSEDKENEGVIKDEDKENEGVIKEEGEEDRSSTTTLSNRWVDHDNLEKRRITFKKKLAFCNRRLRPRREPYRLVPSCIV